MSIANQETYLLDTVQCLETAELRTQIDDLEYLLLLTDPDDSVSHHQSLKGAITLLSELLSILEPESEGSDGG